MKTFALLCPTKLVYDEAVHLLRLAGYNLSSNFDNDVHWRTYGNYGDFVMFVYTKDNTTVGRVHSFNRVRHNELMQPAEWREYLNSLTTTKQPTITMQNLSILVKTQQEYDSLIAYFKSQGVLFGSPTNHNYFADYNRRGNGLYLIYYGASTKPHLGVKAAHTDAYAAKPIVTFEQFSAIKNVPLVKSNVTIRLNSSHECVLDFQSKTAQIGCQRIDFDKIVEVYRAMQ